MYDHWSTVTIWLCDLSIHAPVERGDKQQKKTETVVKSRVRWHPQESLKSSINVGNLMTEWATFPINHWHHISQSVLAKMVMSGDGDMWMG